MFPLNKTLTVSTNHCRCLSFNNLNPNCTLMDDPNDPCCKTPNCPAGITVVPNTGQAVTGFQPAVYPNNVGGVPGGTTGGQNPSGQNPGGVPVGGQPGGSIGGSNPGGTGGVVGGNPGGVSGGTNPFGGTASPVTGQRSEFPDVAFLGSMVRDLLARRKLSLSFGTCNISFFLYRKMRSVS